MFKFKFFIRRIIVLILFLIVIKYYLHNETSDILTIDQRNKSRINFLEKSFCGKFISGTWQKTINQTSIDQRNHLLKSQLNQWENFDDKISCEQFIKTNGFYSKEINPIEYSNPTAFSILVYKHFYQFQVLLRTLYLRINYHCIHIDAKAPSSLFNYALKLSKCLDNVFLSPQRLNITWGTMSILQAQRICQQILLNKSSKWYYHITLAGSELPIETNRNRIQILLMRGNHFRNDVSSVPQVKNRQSSKKINPPGNITIYKGEFHSILTRDFIQSIEIDSLSNEIWNYLNGTSVPDEHFYPTLVHLEHLPGGKERHGFIYPYYELLSHYKSWNFQPFHLCQSNNFIEGVCQFNFKDLSNIEKSRKLFANKFNQDFDLISIHCWEQWLNLKQKFHLDIIKQDYQEKYPFTQTNLTLNKEDYEDFQRMIKYMSSK